MRTLSRRREYVGEWLPESLLTSLDVAEDVELAESVSIAMPTVLETLEPTQRVLLMLREVFEMPDGEIAEALGKSPSAVRQVAWRAREHGGGSAAAGTGEPVGAAARAGAVPTALRTGQIRDLMEIVTPEVVLTADGGGLVSDARTPIQGAAHVARLVAHANQVQARGLTTTGNCSLTSAVATMLS
jgi:hypothetical protein